MQNKTKPLKIGVAMSGGVDSSVTAVLLRQSGCEVTGFFMALAQPDLDLQIARVQRVAAHIGVSLEVVDLRAEFEREVLTYFSGSYSKGKTPNPCMICNRMIKFGRLLDIVTARGFDFLATGHYARIIHGAAGPTRLLKGKDPDKDQSYFLSRLTREQLGRIRLPLGEYTKKGVYGIAAELGMQGIHSAESQDVCFLHGLDVAAFLAQQGGCSPPPGPVVTVDGRYIGRHDGIHAFTVGQRRGLSIPDATPYYVVGLDARENKVIVGKKADLLREALVVQQINWIAGRQPALPEQFEVRIRYRHGGAAAVVDTDRTSETAGRLRVRFLEPQRAITPGQFAVFYRGEEVIGSGEICG